jgi:hypothetical protein
MEGQLELMLVNARHVGNLQGRKSGVFGAAWLAQVGAYGLVHGASDITGVSGRSMLQPRASAGFGASNPTQG